MLGSFANIAAAVTVAASSFAMELTDPTPLLAEIDHDLWQKYKEAGSKSKTKKLATSVTYSEPNFQQLSQTSKREIAEEGKGGPVKKRDPIRSKVVTLGDFIDTDAVSFGSNP